MATYVPNASTLTEPTSSRMVGSAAEEFRVLKTSLDTRADLLEADMTAAEAATDALEVDVAELQTQMAGIAAGTDSTALAAALGSSTAGQGSALVGVHDSLNWFSALATKTVESLLGYIGGWLWGRDVNVFEYMTAAEIASVKAYNFSVDVTMAVQTAMDAAWTQKRDLFLPGGGYLVTGLTLPGTYPTLDERYKAFRMYGQGYGNPFSTLNTGGTVIKSVTDAPVITDRALTAPNSHGTFELSHMRLDGTSNSFAVLKLDSFYGTSSIHNMSIHQRGTGDGVFIDYGATAVIRECYVTNKDQTTFNLGAARTGVGFNIPNSYAAGLVKIIGCTSRGWLDGYIIGLDSGTQTADHYLIHGCEGSTIYNGVTLQSKAQYCTVSEMYFEQIEGGTGIIDKGNYNKIYGNQMTSGHSIGIDLRASGFGGVCAWNLISTSTVEGAICINVVLSSGLGRTVSDNTIVWASSGVINPSTGVPYANIIGIKVSGANAQVNLSGNMFSPKINWVGSGTYGQIVDITTSTLSAGNGQYGFGTASFNNLQVPMLNQGAISLAIDPTAITGVSAGVCSLTHASDFLITFAGATNITSFTAPNLEGKLFCVRVTNGNCTFVNGASLKMNGAANYTPGASGASIWFKVHSNVAWEQFRTAY